MFKNNIQELDKFNQILLVPNYFIICYFNNLRKMGCVPVKKSDLSKGTGQDKQNQKGKSTL